MYWIVIISCSNIISSLLFMLHYGFCSLFKNPWYNNYFCLFSSILNTSYQCDRRVETNKQQQTNKQTKKQTNKQTNKQTDFLSGCMRQSQAGHTRVMKRAAETYSTAPTTVFCSRHVVHSTDTASDTATCACWSISCVDATMRVLIILRDVYSQIEQKVGSKKDYSYD